jgi:hypothetical protein
MLSIVQCYIRTLRPFPLPFGGAGLQACIPLINSKALAPEGNYASEPTSAAKAAFFLAIKYSAKALLHPKSFINI